MPDYMRRLWQSRLCPALVPAGFYDDSGQMRSVLKTEGLIRINEYARSCPDGIEGSFCALLHMLASTADSFALLQQWLAAPEWICLDPESLFYSISAERTLLLFCEKPDPRPFAERFCETCDALGGSGQLIAARFSDLCACRVLEEKGTASFLRGWRREILTVR